MHLPTSASASGDRVFAHQGGTHADLELFGCYGLLGHGFGVWPRLGRAGESPECRRDHQPGFDQYRGSCRPSALWHSQRSAGTRRLRYRGCEAARQISRREGQSRAAHFAEPHSLPRHQQGGPHRRHFRRHARAREAGAVLDPLQRDRECGLRPEGQGHQIGRGSEGPARRGAARHGARCDLDLDARQ